MEYLSNGPLDKLTVKALRKQSAKFPGAKTSNSSRNSKIRCNVCGTPPKDTEWLIRADAGATDRVQSVFSSRQSGNEFQEGTSASVVRVGQRGDPRSLRFRFPNRKFCAPWKGAISEWETNPPGNYRSSR
jgi:hypothetical protein